MAVISIRCSKILHVFVCLVLMFVVLLQQGRGGGLGRGVRRRRGLAGLRRARRGQHPDARDGRRRDDLHAHARRARVPLVVAGPRARGPHRAREDAQGREGHAPEREAGAHARRRRNSDDDAASTNTITMPTSGADRHGARADDDELRGALKCTATRASGEPRRLERATTRSPSATRRWLSKCARCSRAARGLRANLGRRLRAHRHRADASRTRRSSTRAARAGSPSRSGSTAA